MTRVYVAIILFVSLFTLASALPTDLQDLPHADIVSTVAPIPERAPPVIMRSQSVEPAQTYLVLVKDPESINELKEYAQALTGDEKKQLKETMRSFAISSQQQNPSRTYNTFNAFSISLTSQQKQALQNHPLIQVVEENLQVHTMLDDSTELINATTSWDLQIGQINLTGKDTSVCIIDTGVDYTHPALGGCNTTEFLAGECKKVPGGYDFVNNDPDPMDDEGHGTHVAGIAAADGSIKGVAPHANIIAIKALNAQGSGSFEDIAAGIDWCTDNKDTYNITTIGMSLGTSCSDGFCWDTACDSSSPSMTAAINAAVNAGISVAAASGNDGSHTGISLPACISSATAIASSTKQDGISSFSNRNHLSPIIAPGTSILSTTRGGGTGFSSGTSMATPHVVGAMTILHQQGILSENLRSPSQIESLLETTGKHIFDSESNRNYSRTNLFEALTEEGPVTTATFAGGWQNQPFNVTLNASSKNFEIAYTSYQLNDGPWINATIIFINTSQEHNLSFFSVDNNDIQEPTQTVFPLLDMVDPQTTTNNTESWMQAPTIITLNATDSLSGISYSQYKIDNGSWINGTNISFNESGNFTVSYQSIDVAGNIENVSNTSVLVDASPPNISITYPSSWQNTNVTVNWSATDLYSGVNYTQYNLNNSSWINATNLTLSESGNYTLLVRAVDNVNNTNTSQATILIDKNPPITTDDAPLTWQSQPVNITLNASDDLSGINYTTYRLNNDSWQNNTYVFINASGNHTLQYYSVDVAANTENTTNTTVLMDLDEPIINATYPSGWQNESFNITFDVQDMHSGLKEYFVSFDNQSLINLTNLSISQEANHTVIINATDNVNNTVQKVIFALLDMSPPTTTTQNLTGWQNTNTTIFFNASDELSGVSYTQYRINQTDWINATELELSDGNYSIQYRSVDFANNVEEPNNKTVLIDTIAPHISNVLTNSTQLGVNETILIQANITDTNDFSVNITINETPLSLIQDGNIYAAEFTPNQSGNYQATITAIDIAKNIATQNISFSVYEKQSLQNISVNDTVIDAKNTTRTTLRLKTTQPLQANITLLSSKKKPVTINAPLNRAFTHKTILLSENLKQSLMWANISINYDDEDIQDLDESTIGIFRYNQTSDEWIKLSTELNYVSAIGHDMQNNVVWANVSTFSTYALSADEPQQTSTQPSGGGSGGSGGGGGGGGAASASTNANESIITLRNLNAKENTTKSIDIQGLSLKEITFVLAEDIFLFPVTITKEEPASNFLESFSIQASSNPFSKMILVFDSQATHISYQGREQNITNQTIIVTSLGTYSLLEKTITTQEIATESEPEVTTETESVVEPVQNYTETTRHNPSSIPIQRGNIFILISTLMLLAILAFVFTLRTHKK